MQPLPRPNTSSTAPFLHNSTSEARANHFEPRSNPTNLGKPSAGAPTHLALRPVLNPLKSCSLRRRFAGLAGPAALLLFTLSVPSISHSATVSELEKQVAELTTKLQRTNNDWARLGRYEADNAELGLPAKEERRVVFYGDSITDAWPRRTDYFANHPNYVGRGISGQTTSQMLVRFHQDVIALKPEVVVILAGTNDIAGNTGPYESEHTQNCLEAMTEIAQSHGIKVVLCSVLPAYEFKWSEGKEPALKIVALNKWIQDYAARSGSLYLDYFTPMADDRPGLPPEYSGDEVHPNSAGYAIMEKLAESVIAKALSSN